MGKISKYVDVTSSAFSDNNIKSVALKEFMSENLGKFYLDSVGSDKKQIKEKKEKKQAYIDEEEEGIAKDTELETAMYMLQSYPCLRYNIESYIPILKRKVIGQDEILKKLVFVAYFNQYVNFIEDYTKDENYSCKSMLLIAPTGSGKSTMLRALEKAFDVPVYRANITATTSAGYVGDKVESMLMGLIERANGDILKAERGILLIDEIDKKITSTTTERDVAGKAVQQELLKLFERGTVNVPISKKNMEGTTGKYVEFNTGFLTIILAGACVGLDEIRKKRLGFNKKIGFNDFEKVKKDLIEEYTPEDLIEYGFIPELVGRIDIIEEFEPYTQNKLVDIIYFSDESSMQEHVRILNSLGVEKIMIDGALWERIAEEILDNKLGVRELNRMMTKLFYPILYEAFQHTCGEGTCTIDSDGKYTLMYKKEKKVYTGNGLELKDFDEELIEI